MTRRRNACHAAVGRSCVHRGWTTRSCSDVASWATLSVLAVFFAVIELVQGHYHGHILTLPFDEAGNPWSPVLLPHPDLPGNRLLAYELAGHTTDDTWIYRMTAVL